MPVVYVTRLRPVESLRALTSAPTMAAPVWSLPVPASLPLVCAWTHRPSAKTQISKSCAHHDINMLLWATESPADAPSPCAFHA